MQCLFCGKELALLKRLRGGGEFCSEAHRKEYQEQYEQLALARLLQAKPPSEPAAPLGRPSAAPIASDPISENPGREVLTPATLEPQVQASVATIEAPAYSQSIPQSIPEKAAELKPAEEASPAPLAGFLSEPVVPAVTVCQVAGLLELERVTAPSLPSGVPSAVSAASAASGPEGRLLPAQRVDFDLSLQALDHHTRASERGMELREFTGPAPVMELHLRPATGTEPAGAADVMEILMSPQPPQKATPWLGAPRGFPVAPAELGQLARLDFITIGFAYSDGATPAQSTNAPQAGQPVQPAAETVEARVPPVPAEAPLAGPPPPAEPAPPGLVTRALPVTLHGQAAPRGKFVQTITSAIAAAADVQIPPSATLPLRPAIVFGPSAAPTPAPAAAPVQPKPTQPKPIPAKLVQTKPVQEKTEEAKPEERVRPSVVPPPKPVPVKRSVAPETAIQERNAPKVSPPAALPARPRVDRRADSFLEPRAESPGQQSLPASDAAFPSLRLEATEGAWSKLSTGLKIGVAAAVIVGVSGIAYLVTRGGGKTIKEAPAVAASATPAASGVPISGGWIDDWANAAKSRRHISLLSGSAKLSDYRVEFQAQIESKAIGWIFRGLNPRNYYVAKLETITPGLEPTVALVHFAVVDGQDEDRVVVPLPMKVRVDTNYKIRFDAIGNRFTTWVQDQKIAEWTDSRFGSGGVGFFSEQNEKAAMQGSVNVVALVPKN